MKIDIHGHFVDPHYLDDLQRVMTLEVEKTADGKTLMRHNGYTLAWTRPDMFDMDYRLRDMDQKGIDMRVITVSTPGVYPWHGDAQVRMARHVNDMLARDCRAHPDRFIGFASLPLHDVEASLAEIDRATAELGMKGVAIGSNIGGPPLNDARFEPLWAKLDAMRLPVFEHPMFPRDTSEMGEFELPLRVGLIFDTTLVAARLSVRALPELPLHHGAHRRRHHLDVRAARQRLSAVSRLPQVHQQAAERVRQAALLRHVLLRRGRVDARCRLGRAVADPVRHRRSLHRGGYQARDAAADHGRRQGRNPRRQRDADARPRARARQAVIPRGPRYEHLPSCAFDILAACRWQSLP
jgi:hypothetical protein